MSVLWSEPYGPELDRIPERVVSLVPSYTESLFDLGFGARVVGVSDYCTQPAGQVERAARIGGTKNPRIQEIVDLSPDLVLANPEENSRQSVEELSQAGIPVWVTFPKTTQDVIEFLSELVRVFGGGQKALMEVRTLQDSLNWTAAAASSSRRLRYFCPIWQGGMEDGTIWWMTFNRDTYSHSLLDGMGGENIFGARQRRYPLEADLGKAVAEEPAGRDTRYPCVTVREVVQAQPEVIILPDEPYAFGSKEIGDFAQWLEDTPAAKTGRIFTVDGSLVTWCGTRMGKALIELAPVFGAGGW